MNISFKIREDDDIAWLKNMYEQFKNEDSCNRDEIDFYKELFVHTSQDVDSI